MEDLIDAENTEWGRWQRILKDRYDGDVLILDGIAYSPEGEDDHVFGAKILRSSESTKAAAGTNGRTNGTTVKPH